MRAPVPSWRVGDALAYDDAVAAAAESIGAADGSADASFPLSRAVSTDGFARAEVNQLPTASRPRRDATAVGSFDSEAVLDSQILPILFGGAEASTSPRIILLGGEGGSGRSRAISRLVAEREDGIAVVSPAILRAFVPEPTASAGSPSVQVEEVVGGWLGSCLRYAREHQLPLLVDAPFPSLEVTLGLLGTFRREGFEPQVAVVAVSRAEALLSVTSEHLRRDARAPLDVSAVDGAIRNTRDVLAAIDASDIPVRVAVFDRNGTDTTAVGNVGAAGARDRAASTTMSTLQAVQWLSELRRITEFIQHPAARTLGVEPAVAALHDEALKEVIPKLAVPAGSKVAKLLENRIVSELVPLRRSDTPTRQPRPTGPEATPAAPSMSGPSR